jgi:CheY-like chemotaxis protein
MTTQLHDKVAILRKTNGRYDDRVGEIVGYDGQRVQVVIEGDPYDEPQWFHVGDVSLLEDPTESVDAALGEHIRESLNRASRENHSNTPDWILTDFLMGCLAAFELATQRRDNRFNDQQISAEFPKSLEGQAVPQYTSTKDALRRQLQETRAMIEIAAGRAVSTKSEAAMLDDLVGLIARYLDRTE